MPKSRQQIRAVPGWITRSVLGMLVVVGAALQLATGLHSQTTPAQNSKPLRNGGAQAAMSARFSAGQMTEGIAQMQALPKAAAPGPWITIGPRGIGNQLGVGSAGYCGDRPVVPASGRATAIGFGLNSGTVYLGTAGGGVWKSANGGTTWTPMTDFEPSLAVGSLRVLPGANSGKDVIYVGTGEDNQAGDNLYGEGLLESTDSGNTWTQLAASTFAGQTFGGLAVVPGQGGNPNILYAATGQGTIGSSTSVIIRPAVTAGVYQSIDGGTTWTMLSGEGWITGGRTDQRLRK